MTAVIAAETVSIRTFDSDEKLFLSCLCNLKLYLNIHGHIEATTFTYRRAHNRALKKKDDNRG